jgi:tetratricopeptide (TPR) repeat protein
MAIKDTQKAKFAHRDVFVYLLLVVATFVVYWQVRNFEFVNYDDQIFVTENRHVQAGLTLEGISYIFSDRDATIVGKLALLSHMLDCELFGLDPGWHHLTSLFFHIANSVFLLITLKRMTGAFWRSAFVAALFAFHPLNVDSVAWVAERKNVLSTFFWILTMLTYAHYAERPGVIRYLVVLLCFILGLIAKPMLVTLPFVLLLMDYWPLDRIRFKQSENDSVRDVQNARILEYKRSTLVYLALEKIPLIVCAVGASLLTFFVVEDLGYIHSFDKYSLQLRIANALVSYVSYLGMMIWPYHLAVLYPHPLMIPGWQVAGACLLLISISVLAIVALKRGHLYFLVGWLWYIGTLVPVIGLVHMGEQAMADRFTYVPLIGIFIIIAWGVPEFVARWRYRESGLAITAATLILILAATTVLQLRYWHNSITLFEHALDVTTNNTTAQYNLALGLEQQGRLAEAMEHYSEALRIEPGFVKAHNNLGLALSSQGKEAEAIAHFSEALRLNPQSERAHNNLGLSLMKQGKIAEAINHYYDALRLNPDYVEAHNNLGLALFAQGKFDMAKEHYTTALRLNPDFLEAHYNLGSLLKEQGMIAEAINHYSEVLRLNPKSVEARNNLGLALVSQGKVGEAIIQYSEALRLDPDAAEVHINLGNALMGLGRSDEALEHYYRALQLNPDSAEVQNNLGAALVHSGKTEEGIVHFREALRIRPDYAEAHDNLKMALEMIKQGR